MLKRVNYIIGYLSLTIGSYFSLLILKPEKNLGEIYRIFFFHFPLAIASYISFFLCLVFSIAYLKKRNLQFDDLASSSAEVGLLFCILAIITGAIFSKYAWGEYWCWDPKQTTTLMVCLVYASYLALRSSIDEYETKARSSSVFGIFAFFTVILSYVSTRIWFSLHPTIITRGGIALEKEMVIILLLMLCGMLSLCSSLIIINKEIKRIERKVRNE
ncbi:MAG: cytochrome C assembly protein [Thermoplasmata archaeon]|nr:MAG: cytochrome C assembly protein [Thermoplasmata archaeon]